MASVDVFGPRMVLRVIRKVDGGFIIDVQCRRRCLLSAQLAEDFAAGERDWRLFFGGPRDSRAVVYENVAGGGMACCPIGV
eukprot:5235408-Pleurochrysis_carterae.AAC.1